MLVAAACALLAGCRGSDDPAPPPPVLTLLPQAVSIPAGGRNLVSASVTGAPAGVPVMFRWRVRDSAIVVIDSLSTGGSVAHLRRIAPGGTVVTVSVPALGLSGDIPVVAFP